MAEQLDPNSFNKAFTVLQRHASNLAKATDLDIDGLLPAVQESSAAAAICEERIKQVEAALEEMFKGRGGREAPAGSAPQVASGSAGAADDLSDDVPF